MNYNVIISSIGTATPNVSKILSDILSVPHEFISKLLYSTPSILFKKVDHTTALQVKDKLETLGLEVLVTNKTDSINLSPQIVDVSVYFDDVLMLPKVTTQLSKFLGCDEVEALNLLMNQPSIVLGNVSEATAIALEKQLEASVCYSDSKKDLYSIMLPINFDKNKLKSIEKQLNTNFNQKDSIFIAKDISYASAQVFWRNHQSDPLVKLINQTHQLVNVILEDFDLTSINQTNFLLNEVGMETTILEDIKHVLPVILFEKISFQKADSILKQCALLGIKTAIEKDYNYTNHLQIDQINDLKGVRNILAQFIPQDNLPKEKDVSWESKEKIPSLVARYLQAQLEYLNCEPKLI